MSLKAKAQKLWRSIAKLAHPDLALDLPEIEQKRRHFVMAEANVAYGAEDAPKLDTILVRELNYQRAYKLPKPPPKVTLFDDPLPPPPPPKPRWPLTRTRPRYFSPFYGRCPVCGHKRCSHVDRFSRRPSRGV